MLQAGGRNWFALHLSGVTPGQLDTDTSHRATRRPPGGHPVTQDQTRWSIVSIPMEPVDLAARKLARLLLAGPFTVRDATSRIRAGLGRCPRWLSKGLNQWVPDIGEGARPRQQRIQALIRSNADFQTAFYSRRLRLPSVPPTPIMLPAAGAPQTWNLPSLTSIRDLADFLQLTPGELEWFADLKSLNSRTTEARLIHYRYRWQPKKGGGARLIELPKLRLKQLQRHILHEILNRIPPHEAAHGFRSGHSIHSFVAPHVAQEMLLRLDLRDFFPNISRARVIALFLTAGYPEPIALRLGGICTNGVPTAILDERPAVQTLPFPEQFRLRKLYQAPHLPQGAPSSPALANLAAHRLDCRLSGLADSARAHYTRYADDLVFSGGKDFARSAEQFAVLVCTIALEEGFEVQIRKTRLMRKSVSQHAAGLVLNQKANIPRREYETLKAILHNCVRFGPASQSRQAHPDFQAHLLGRIAHLATVNPTRAHQLRAQFERIDWGVPPPM